jgi:hypothetical protein
MTIADPRSDRNGKVEPAPPGTRDGYPAELWPSKHPRDDRDFVMLVHEMGMPFTRIEALADAYRSWELAIEELHNLMVAELVADHDNRMPEDWQP